MCYAVFFPILPIFEIPAALDFDDFLEETSQLSEEFESESEGRILVNETPVQPFWSTRPTWLNETSVEQETDSEE